MNKHTPTPWRVDHGASKRESTMILAGSGREVASMPDKTGESIGNAALIVRACNAHDALVAALRDFVEALRSTDPTDPTDLPRRMGSLVPSARAALALAEEK